jgi:hypothetical protein
MTATVKQICELRDTVIDLQRDLSDLRDRSVTIHKGQYLGILDQQDRDTVCMIMDAAAERKQDELNRVLAEVTISVEGV